MKNQKGFTLIEVIVTLILVGIMASMAGMGIVSGVQGYLFAKDNAAISQKAQAAMARLNRTFTEVLDITTVETNPTRVTYNRLINGVNTEETLYLDATDQTLKIAVGGNPAGGDRLVDHVASLGLSFFRGTAAWNTSHAFNLLSSITVNLTLTRPAGGSDVSFTTAVTPRNNGNLGGDVPPTAPPDLSAGGCFVTTAAFGHENHPMVSVFKEFRDRCLLTWSGGRTLVRLYYTDGPFLADQICGNTWACIFTQALLLPFAGLAFLMLHALIAVPVAIGLFWAAMVFSPRFFPACHRRIWVTPRNQKGGVLIGLIVTMVIFGFIGAAMISLTNTATFSQLGANTSQRAYYLAEAGMRFAASEFRDAPDATAKDNTLEALNSNTFSMGGDGQFHLDIYPYYFITRTDPNGDSTLLAKFPGSVPADISIPSTGFLKIRSESTPREYTSRTLSGSDIAFAMATPLPSYPVGTGVLSVGKAQAGNLSRNGSLSLSSGSGLFPLINGTFTIGTAASTTGATADAYVYERRNGSVLENVRLSRDKTASFTISVPTNANVTLAKFVDLKSRGIFGLGTPLAAERTVSYSVPIASEAGGGNQTDKEPFSDFFDNDLDHWFTGSGQLGGHEVQSQGGNNALRVTDTYDIEIGWLWKRLVSRQSLITLNWGSTNVNMHQSWLMADHLLSYDAQVKIRAHNQDYYMPGIIFRIDNLGRMYGVSFLRADTGTSWGSDRDGIPDEVCPLDRTAMIVLWMQKPSDEVNWLAYKTLSSSDGVIDSNGRYLLDWSSLLVRVIEADSLQFNSGNVEFRYGDTVTGATSGAEARVNGTPILTGGTWSSNNAAGWLTVENVTKSNGNIQFQNGEDLLVDGAVQARYTGSSRQKDNYIRVYFGNTGTRGTPDTNPLNTNNRLGNPRITPPGDLKWPVDDVSDWAPANDAFTLVQWDNASNPSVTGGDAVLRLGTGPETNAIIRTNALNTPDSGTFTRAEVGLDTWGSSSTSVYFDDYGVQAFIPSQAVFGTPIQQ